MADVDEAILAQVRGTLEELHQALWARVKKAEADVVDIQKKYDALLGKHGGLVATLREAVGTVVAPASSPPSVPPT